MADNEHDGEASTGDPGRSSKRPRPRVPIEDWIPEEPHDFSDWMPGIFLPPTPEVGVDEQAKKRDKPKRGRFVSNGEKQGRTEITPSGMMIKGRRPRSAPEPPPTE